MAITPAVATDVVDGATKWTSFEKSGGGVLQKVRRA
jgi:hypothetical protein